MVLLHKIYYIFLLIPNEQANKMNICLYNAFFSLLFRVFLGIFSVQFQRVSTFCGFYPILTSSQNRTKHKNKMKFKQMNNIFLQPHTFLLWRKIKLKWWNCRRMVFLSVAVKSNLYSCKLNNRFCFLITILQFWVEWWKKGQKKHTAYVLLSQNWTRNVNYQNVNAVGWQIGYFACSSFSSSFPSWFTAAAVVVVVVVVLLLLCAHTKQIRYRFYAQFYHGAQRFNQ